MADRMRWCVERADRLPEMGENAAKAARRYDWSWYHRRVVRVIDEILTASPASTPQG